MKIHTLTIGCDFRIVDISRHVHPLLLSVPNVSWHGQAMNFDEASDGGLVIGIVRLQQEWLAELDRRHGGTLLFLAQRVLRADDLAEELVENTLRDLWRDPGMFDSERSSLRAYLMAQVHIRAVDILRSPDPRLARQGQQASPVKGGDVPGDQLLDTSFGERVREALRTLSPDEEKTIALAYFGAHTYREIAVLLNEPENTVKSRVNSALGQIAISLLGLGGLP